jgi:rhamnose transport system ATP-binding protein
MTVRENFSLAVLPSLAKAGFIDRAREQALAQDGIRRFNVKTSSAEQVVNKLSGGNQQKIVLGKWLASNPRLLILDEPTRGIDIGAKVEVHRLIAELAAKGLAIILISSDLPEVLAMSDRIVVLHEGRVTAEIARAEATSERVMFAATGTEASRG